MFEVIEKQFKCVCGDHMIEIIKFSDYPNVFLHFWYCYPNNETFLERLKTLWKLLRQGKEMYADIIFTPAMARKLSTFLAEAAGGDQNV